MQLLNHVLLFAASWIAAHQASLSFTISLSLLKFISIELVYYLTISSSVASFSCLRSFPASGSFPESALCIGWPAGASASASVLPMNIQGWFPLGLKFTHGTLVEWRWESHRTPWTPVEFTVYLWHHLYLTLSKCYLILLAVLHLYAEFQTKVFLRQVLSSLVF